MRDADVGQHDVHDAHSAYCQRDRGYENKDRCESGCDSRSHGEQGRQILRFVYGIGFVSGLNYLENFILCGWHFFHGADGEVDLLDAVGAGEITRDGVGDQNG